MTQDEALKLALEALTYIYTETTADEDELIDQAITAIKEALSEPEQKYHRGDRLICLETEEYCVIHISGTDRQWVKFPDSHIGVYTNEQVAELFELLPKEPEQEPVAWMFQHEETGRTVCIDAQQLGWGFEKGNPRLKKIAPLYTTPPHCTWVRLTDDEIWKFWWARPEIPEGENDSMEAEFVAAVRAVLAAHGIKGD